MNWLQDAIGGPRECLQVDSPEAYELWARRVRMGMRAPAALKRATRSQPAHVSDGRWCFDCPCGSAGLASHEWGVGICVDCGVIHPVTFPDDRAEAEATLLARPNVLHRHYFPHAATARRRGLARGETVEHLEAENVARKVPVRRRPAKEAE